MEKAEAFDELGGSGASQEAQGEQLVGGEELGRGVAGREVEENPGMQFEDGIFVCGRERTRLTRSQKRASRRKYAAEGGSQGGQDGCLDMTSDELRDLQEKDDTLAAVRRAAIGEACSAGVGFFKQDGLLYRKWTPPGQDKEEMVVEQLVLPARCRQVVLRLAHEIPLAGHMGRNKTARRLLQRFYWPSLYKDVAEFCKSCEECQKTSPRQVKRAHDLSTHHG